MKTVKAGLTWFAMVFGTGLVLGGMREFAVTSVLTGLRRPGS